MSDELGKIATKTTMFKEILEEPSTISASFQSSINNIHSAVKTIKESKIVYIAGSGTSFHLGLITQLHLLRCGIAAVTIRAPEFSHFIPDKVENACAILISQSGQSSDILNCLDICKKNSMRTICITNSRDSKLADNVDIPLLTDAGIERSVAATKSFVSGLVPAYILLSQLKSFDGNSDLEMVSDEIGKVLELWPKLEEIAKTIRSKIVFLGDGYLHAMAMEAALKFRETSNLITEAYPVREYLHGPIQTLDNDTSVFIMHNTKDSALVDVESKLRNYTDSIIKVGTSDGDSFRLKAIKEELSPFVFSPVIQTLANFTSVNLGLDPDRPSHLTKVVS